MTIGECLEQVKRNISFEAPQVEDSLLFIANAVMRRIERMFDWSFEYTVEATKTQDAQGNPTKILPLPTGCKRLLYITYPIEEPQSPIVIASYVSDEFYLSRTSPSFQKEPGRPRGFLLRADHIELVPTPDKVYDIFLHYYKWLPEFTSLQDTNALIQSYPDMVVEFITAQVLFQLGETQEAMVWEQKATLKLNEAIRHDKMLRVSQPAYIEPLPPQPSLSALERWKVTFE